MLREMESLVTGAGPLRVLSIGAGGPRWASSPIFAVMSDDRARLAEIFRNNFV